MLIPHGRDAATSVANYALGPDIEFIDQAHRDLQRGMAEEDGAIRPATGASGRSPIFIVGLPRTGTTLTERILASHSRIG